MARLYIPHSICSWHSCITYALLTSLLSAFALSSSHSLLCFPLSSSFFPLSFCFILISFHLFCLFLFNCFLFLFPPLSLFLNSLLFLPLVSSFSLRLPQKHFFVPSSTLSSPATFRCMSCFFCFFCIAVCSLLHVSSPKLLSVLDKFPTFCLHTNNSFLAICSAFLPTSSFFPTFSFL